MSLELTENKSNIGSGALNDLVFIFWCRVIGQWLSTRQRSVGNQSAISWGVISNWLAIGRQLVGDCILSVCFWLQKLCNFSEIGRQPIGDWSVISRRLKTVSGLSAIAATGGRSVANQSATTKNLSRINLVAERFHLQQPKPPCDQIVPATFCNRLATSRRPPCNHPATSLRPPEILVARRSPTGCKLCVTGALAVIIWRFNQRKGI